MIQMICHAFLKKMTIKPETKILPNARIRIGLKVDFLEHLKKRI